MSEPKLISPFLDGFAMGDPLSDHDGVRCCPAMKEDSDNKYIVKIISVPASQVQLEALLLTGACQDKEQAMAYFKELADGVVKEAKFLTKLSRKEGFVPYESWQVVPMEGDETGYDIYLISDYKRSLDKFTRRNLMTHLGAVNLGLDMCAALAICRRAGCIYADLKPSNIFISDDKEYRIGDLGFISMSSLKYTSLPSKYISAYTAPELLDPMVTLNTTADIYSIGMILYQVYNNGELPFEGHASAEEYPTPVNADYEIAEIIMKAIAPDPKDRWQTPIEMGQALVAYMQRNTVNDVPIASPSAPVTVPETDVIPVEEEAPAEVTAAVQDIMSELTADETAPGEEDAAQAQNHPVSQETAAIMAEANDLLAGTFLTDSGDQSGENPAVTGEDPQAPAAQEVPAHVEEPAEAEKPAAEPQPKAEDEDEDDEFDFLRDVDLGDGEKPEADDGDSEPVSEPGEETVEKPKKKKGWIVALIIGILLALLACGGYVYYKFYYQMPVNSLNVSTYEDQVTVTVNTDADTSLLTVVCTDINGTVQRMALTNGQAVFTGLTPDTQYKIHLEVEGRHALVGSTNASFSTAALTTITSFTAATGNEDGSVILNFTVDGPGTDDWTVRYVAEGEEEKSMTFTGHMVTINGLTVGKTYSFELLPGSDLYMDGNNNLEFTASAIVLAKDLAITDYADGTLTATWETPEGMSVANWIVRCYSDDGQSEVIETSENTIVFNGIDPAKAYTVEVSAAGMTQSVRTHLTVNPTNITKVNFNESDKTKMVITWEYTGATPDGGWLLMYSYDQSGTQEIIRCTEPRVEISPRIPGATYNIVIQSASGSSVFGNHHSFKASDATYFQGGEINFKPDYTKYYLCKTPTKEGWEPKNVKQDNYTTTFKLGDPISILIKSPGHWLPKGVQVSVLFVIRDESGSVVTSLTDLQQINWYSFWEGRYPWASFDIPHVPTSAGNYTLSLYFNHSIVTSMEFTVTE